jgi:thiol-disulfide isomerase/thioredoxin
MHCLGRRNPLGRWRAAAISICIMFVSVVTGAQTAEPQTTGSRITAIGGPELRAALDQLAGRVVLVNFWATWCSPCLKEIPVLLELEAELAEQGFTLLAVSLDEADSETIVVEPFVNRWFPGFASYLSVEYDMDTMVSVLDPGWNAVLPTSYLIGRNGVVAERIQGSYTKDEFSTALLPLLQEDSQPR